MVPFATCCREVAAAMNSHFSKHERLGQAAACSHGAFYWPGLCVCTQCFLWMFTAFCVLQRQTVGCFRKNSGLLSSCSSGLRCLEVWHPSPVTPSGDIFTTELVFIRPLLQASFLMSVLKGTVYSPARALTLFYLPGDVLLPGESFGLTL